MFIISAGGFCDNHATYYQLSLQVFMPENLTSFEHFSPTMTGYLLLVADYDLFFYFSFFVLNILFTFTITLSVTFSKISSNSSFSLSVMLR